MRSVRLVAIFLLLSGFAVAVANKARPQLRHGVYRGMPVTYVVQGGRNIFQGDIILEKVDSMDPSKPLPPSFGLNYYKYLWPKVGNQFQIPYVIAAGSGDLTNLNAALTQFNTTFSNIQFVVRAAQADYVSFSFDSGNFSGECEAFAGRVGGPQTVGGSGYCTVGTILHEMGHTVGLWHEQSRPDRDTYVSVNYEHLIKGSIGNFSKRFDDGQVTTLFDYASIMEYPAFSFSRNGGPAMESIPAGIPLSNQSGYSAADIDGIERMYGNAPTSVTVTSNPPGLLVIVDGVTITTPRVYAWTLLSIHTLDIPSGVQSQAGDIFNSTQPTTFYYTYGRWNDATAASHSITVLPGNGEPANPAASPAVTTYAANFIELVPYTAAIYPTGAGTVTPTPAPQSYLGSSLVFYIARQQATLTATPSTGQNFYEFNNGPFWLPGGLGINPKTFYVPDTGLTVNTTAEFSPDPVYTIDVSPNPFSSNLYVLVDGTVNNSGFWRAPKNFSSFYDAGWTSGSTHTINVDTFEYPYSSNSRYGFGSWSDGGTQLHTVTLPVSSTSYIASMTPDFLVADYANETCGGSINVAPSSPTGDGFYPTGSALTFTETPNPGWLFTGWQYDLSGTASSQPLTVTDEVLVTADYNTTTTTPFALTSLSPSAAVAGGPAFTLMLNGTGFTNSTVVSVNGTFPIVKFISPTQLSVAVTAGQITTPGAFQVSADNFPPGNTCAPKTSVAFAALPFTVSDNPIVLPAPLSLAFTPQIVGTASASKKVTIRNTSASTVNINSISATGGFTLTSNSCGGTLAAAAVCNVNVAFAPVVPGAQTGSVAISDSAPDSPQTVSLTGTGSLPLSFAPLTLAFGTVNVGQTSVMQAITLTNNESSTLIFSYPASGNYAVNVGGTTCGASLVSKASCKIAVTFSPTATGAVNGALQITDGTSFTPQLVSLSGTGAGGATPPLAFTPANLTFAPQVVSTTSAAKTLTVKNVSASSLTLNTIATSGDFSALGSGAKPCSAGLALAASATCTLSVTFAPPSGSSGVINGAVVFSDTAPVSQQIFDAKGTSALPISFAPTSLTFAAQTVATTSAVQIVTLTNNLAVALSPTIASSGEFSAVPGGATPCGASLAAHAKCTLNITFAPSAVGTRSSAITVTDSASPGMQAFSVKGIGQ